MPVTLSTFSQGTITASGINTMFENIEKFINGGIEASDIQTDPKWVEERKLFALISLYHRVKTHNLCLVMFMKGLWETTFILL